MSWGLFVIFEQVSARDIGSKYLSFEGLRGFEVAVGSGFPYIISGLKLVVATRRLLPADDVVCVAASPTKSTAVLHLRIPDDELSIAACARPNVCTFVPRTGNTIQEPDQMRICVLLGRRSNVRLPAHSRGLELGHTTGTLRSDWKLHNLFGNG